jgi:glycosyltransferase involved in cell wall biosynthesis
MLVSIIIPCYNVEDYIEECLISAINQTHKLNEIICIDNNSTDNTWLKLKNLSETYPNIRIFQECLLGAPVARNKGLFFSKGKWIQFLDADDLLDPEKIEHQVRLIFNNPNAGFIAGGYFKRNINGKQKQVYPVRTDYFKALFISSLGITSSNLWNRKYLEKIGGWDEELKSSQETDLMFRILKINENIIYDSAPLTIVRERVSGQISQTNIKENWLRHFYKRVEILDWLKIHKRKYFSEEEQFFLDSLFSIIKIISNKERKIAVNLYNSFLGVNYKPGKFQNHSSLLYLKLLTLFGFNKAEIIRKLLIKSK